MMNRRFGIRLAVAVAVSFFLVVLVASQDARACSGSPPPAVPCSLQMSCGFASAKVYPLPTVALLAPNNAGVKLNALVHISSYNPDCQSCPGLDKLVFDFHVDCSGLVEVQGDGVNDTFDHTYEVDNPHLGINKVAVGFNVVLFDASEFSRTKQPKFQSGVCDVTATATLHLDNGGEILSTCKDGQVCFVPTTTKGNVTTPLIEIIALEPDSDEPGTNNSIEYPGDPQVLRYKIMNRGGTDFNGTLTVDSDNVNVKAVASNLPGGVDPNTFTFGLSEGDGDDFVVGQSVTGGAEECLPLPDQPGQSIGPSTTATLPAIPAGGDFIFEIYAASWGNCGDGSCSQAALSLVGTLDSTPIKGCLTGNFMTSATTEATGNTCTGQATSPVGGLACSNAGQQNQAAGCEEDPECDPDVPLAGRLHWPSASQAKSKPPVLAPPLDEKPVKEGFAGAVFTLKGDKDKLYVIKSADTESSKPKTSTVADLRVDHNLTRVSEELKLDSAVAMNDKVTLKVPFALVQKIDGKPSTPTMTVGSKTTPGSEAVHTFIALSDVHIDTKPGLRTELMTQVSAWMYDEQADKLIPAPLEAVDFKTTESGMELEFDLTAPIAGDDLRVSYDFRSFSREDYEQECDDRTDNDNDGKTDCDDPDCDGHPACDDSTSGAGGAGGGDASSGAGGDANGAIPTGDEGCSCGLVGSPRGDQPLAGLAFLLLGFVSLRRRRA